MVLSSVLAPEHADEQRVAAAEDGHETSSMTFADRRSHAPTVLRIDFRISRIWAKSFWVAGWVSGKSVLVFMSGRGGGEVLGENGIRTMQELCHNGGAARGGSTAVAGSSSRQGNRQWLVRPQWLNWGARAKACAALSRLSLHLASTGLYTLSLHLV